LGIAEVHQLLKKMIQITPLSQGTKRKLSLLQLAAELDNVSKACAIMGHHRDSLYEIKRAFQMGGTAALVESRRGPRNPHPNRVAPEVEQSILDYSLKFSSHGATRTASELRLTGVTVSGSGVRGVCLRHDLETRHRRLLRLEAHARDATYVLSPEQLRSLERASPEFRSRHVEASRPGELLNQDTFYWGTLKGVGKVFVQVVVDVFRSIAFAKVYKSKMPVTAVDTRYERVLPFYDAVGITVGAILTDNGREFCGLQERHPFELFCQLERIGHRTTKVRSPKTNGFVERKNRTLPNEYFRVKGRETWYVATDEIQRDLDQFLDYYNSQCTHQGYRLKGRTPAKALKDAITLDALPPFISVANPSQEVEDADVVNV
jgi:transposase InsO family protein